MADFNGTTSKLENTTADILNGANVMTFCGWTRSDNSSGGGSAGRIITIPEEVSGVSWSHDTPLAGQHLLVDWLQNGEWDFEPITEQVWHAVAFSYNASATTNQPVLRVDFASLSPILRVDPTGTFNQPATGYCIGNRSAQDRGWDGGLAHIQVFNVILNANEMDQALLHPGSVRRGLRLHIEDEKGFDRSGNGFHAVSTSVSFRQGPTAMPYPRNSVAPLGIFPAEVVPGSPSKKRYGGIPWARGRAYGPNVY